MASIAAWSPSSASWARCSWPHSTRPLSPLHCRRSPRSSAAPALVTPILTSFFLTSTAVIAIVGKLSGQLGRKRTVMGGIVIFIAFSAACGAAQDFTQLVVFRAFQGIGAGVIMGSAFVVIADLFSPAERGRYTGFMSGVFGIAAIIGPLVGGFLTDHYTWRWIFYVNLPVGAVVLTVLLLTFPSHRPTGRQKIDYFGALIIITAATLLTLGATRAEDHAWTDLSVVGLLAGGALLLLAAPFYEARVKEAIMPPQMYRSSIFALSSAIAVILGLAMFGSLTFMPLYLQNVVGVSATTSGETIWPLMFAMVGSSIVGGIVLSKTGRYKIQTMLGLSLMATALFLLTLVDVHSTQLQVAAGMVVFGLGLGQVFPVLNVISQNAVDQKYIGPAVSSVQFLRQIGATVGLAALGAIMKQTVSDNAATDFRNSLISHLPAALRGMVPAHVPTGGNLQAGLSLIPDPGVRAQFLHAAQLAKVDAGKLALTQGIHLVFVISFLVVLVAVFLALFIHEIPLRQHAPRAGPTAGARRGPHRIRHGLNRLSHPSRRIRGVPPPRPLTPG